VLTVSHPQSHFTELKYGLLSGASGTSDNTLRWMVNQVTQWSTPLVAGTWYNFAYDIDFSAGKVGLWASQGSAPLTQVVAPVSASASSNGADWHVGVLRLPNGGTNAAAEDFFWSGLYIENGSITTSIAGPQPGTGGSAPSSSSTSTVSTITTSKSTTTSTPVSTITSSSSSSVSSSSPTGCTASHYAQCGGQGKGFLISLRNCLLTAPFRLDWLHGLCRWLHVQVQQPVLFAVPVIRSAPDTSLPGKERNLVFACCTSAIPSISLLDSNITTVEHKSSPRMTTVQNSH
jgi:hypothetical protein